MIRNILTPLALIIGLLVGGVTATVSAVSAAPPAPVTSSTYEAPKTFWMKRPCAQEDSVNCFWDAGKRGNKRGHSFYVRQFKGTICVFYVQRKDAKRWDFCGPKDRAAKTLAARHSATFRF